MKQCWGQVAKRKELQAEGAGRALLEATGAERSPFQGDQRYLRIRHGSCTLAPILGSGTAPAAPLGSGNKQGSDVGVRQEGENYPPVLAC